MVKWYAHYLIENWQVPLAILSVVVAMGLGAGAFLLGKLNNTTSGLCALNVSRIEDKERQIKQSEEFITSSTGASQPAFSQYIKVNALPRLRKEVATDIRNLPKGCERMK